ncbi:MAG: EAL domain-containing protein, partial [Actinobacteria bacterium]|nr:EAL domain-containing protein [Actinomycetota bacterium]NIS31303.1 EAL domain-containing protein [Actinomycetota bacterium]NIU66421.1 EAL domain-containing protein [Actinomycetota bacterium]NIW28235.1 EAL domain-containing protein [Actinomycetota bacterium]NIX20740.1 EAL domain-containing protein [Actinomycetota bacterium]
AVQVGQSLVEAVSEFRFTWQGHHFDIGVSVGVVPITGSSGDAVSVLSRADLACYIAKDRGRGRVHVHSAEERPREPSRDMPRAEGLREALEQGRFCLYCQPVVPLAGEPGRRPLHYELLLRLIDVDGRLVMPDEFMPAAERHGLMAAIDRWVIAAALTRYDRLFRTSGVAINISASSVGGTGLVDYVRTLAGRSAMRPDQVCFEVSERTALTRLAAAAELVSELKHDGYRVAIDDFGKGLGPHGYLRSLPVDYVKIDGGFVRDMAEDEASRATVGAISQVGRLMGLSTIAEQVESTSAIPLLRELAVDYAQGLALGELIAVDELVTTHTIQLPN